MNVGVRELKAKLSEYLSQAAAGKSITVTDRGKPVARLVAYESINSLERGIEQGWIEPPKLRELPELETQFIVADSVLAVLDDDRQ